METKINAIHFDISEKLTSFINKKIDKLTRRYPNVMSAEVSLRVVKPETALNKEAIVSLMVPQEPDQVATKTADTFEEAIDLCMEALDRQLEKVKIKNNSFKSAKTSIEILLKREYNRTTLIVSTGIGGKIWGSKQKYG